MTRRAATGIACVMAVMVGLMAAGLADQTTNQPSGHPTVTASPTPTATVRPAATTTSSYWQQQLEDARVSLEANSTALADTWLDGQNASQLHKQWCAAAKAHNTAARHLQGIDQISTKDCPR